MTGDYFGALARRAVAPAALRPRLASRFEEGGGIGLREQVQETVTAPSGDALQPAARRARPAEQAVRDGTAAHNDETPRHAPTPVPVIHAVQRPVPAQSHRAGPLTELLPQVAAPAPVREPVREPNAAPALRGADQVLAPPASLATPRPPKAESQERVTHERVQMQTLQSRVEARTVERLVVESPLAAATPVAAAPAPSVLQQQAPLAAPRVEIHIGRIEVMAGPTPPQVQAPRSEPTPARPAQSLDAYLAERNTSARRRPA